MGDPITTAIIIGSVTSAASVYEGRKARKDQERAARVDEKRSKISSMRQAVNQIRQAQIARADIVQSGENQDVAGSSGVVGGAGAVQSQATGNIAFAQDIFNLQKSYNRLRMSANKHSFNAQAITQLGSAAMSINNAGGFAPNAAVEPVNSNIANVG